MTRKYPLLCSPFKLGNLTLRNRMLAAPVGGTDMTPEGSIGLRSIAFYEHRARGGAAAVTVSELTVHPETDVSNMFRLNEDVPGSLGGFAYAADAIRRHGAIPSLELSHGGRLALQETPGLRYGPSAMDEPNGNHVEALTKAQLKEIAAAYGRAAGLAKRAGFEMLMVHGGHAWMLNQFLSPCCNFRSDEYGGSTENRCRFVIEVLQSVRAAVGPGFPIEFRMSAVEALEGGYGFDEGVKIAQLVEPYIDLLHVSAGSHFFGFDVTHPSMFDPEGVNVHFAAEMKKHVHVPVATLGALGDPAQMEEIIATGKADLIYMARSLIADPFLPRKVLEGREDEIIRCMRCYACLAERGQSKTRRCALNPVIGRELEGVEVTPAVQKRRVLVAGGGPGGLEAALTAAQRGHQVILCEQSDRLGGIPNCEEGVPFKVHMTGFARTMERLLQKAGVEIRLNTPVTAEYAQAVGADALICALGSAPLTPPIPGIEGGNVLSVNALSGRESALGQRVAVLGGGLAGCETAVHLAALGKTVTLVEQRDALAVDANRLHRNILLEKLEKAVQVRLGCRAVRVTAEGLVCLTPAGDEALIEADTVVLAAGQKPRRAEADSLLDAAPWVVQIGDCVAARNMTAAIYEGYHAAKDI